MPCGRSTLRRSISCPTSWVSRSVDRAEEATLRAGAGDELQPHPVEAVGQRLLLGLQLGDAALLGRLADLDLLDRAGRGRLRQPLRDQVVARVARLDLVQGAGGAELLDILRQDHLHGKPLSCLVAVVARRTVAPVSRGPPWRCTDTRWRSLTIAAGGRFGKVARAGTWGRGSVGA
jgi:hypothetical protein